MEPQAEGINNHNKSFSGNDYLAFLNSFQKQYNEWVLNNDTDENLIQYLESYFGTFPLNRIFLPTIYKNLMTVQGKSQLAKEVARIYVETTSRIQEFGEYSLGIPPIYETFSDLRHIGRLVDSTAYLKQLNK